MKKGAPRTKRAKLRQQSKDTEDALTAGSSAVTPLPMLLSPSSRSEEDLVCTTLIQHIEALEADNARLKNMLDKEKKQKDFGIEQIKHDDKLMVFYTGF